MYRNHLLYSIRWRFVFINLILIAAAFGIASLAISSLFERYLVTQRIEDMEKDVSSVAVDIAPYLRQTDSEEMYSILSQNGQENGGRLLVISNSGIVVADSFSSLNGLVREENEVNDIIYGKQLSSYGFHKIKNQTDNGFFWALFCTSPVISNGNIIGAVLYSKSIQDVINATRNLQINLLLIYVVACIIIFISSLMLTSYITKPVQLLTSVAAKISSGDFATRVNVHGRNEMAELSSTFNMMCDRLQNIDRQRSEFVSNASHELKTPLASMKILVESLLYQDNVAEHVYKEFLSDINHEIDRLSSLINDLLLLSQMDDNNIVINSEKTDLNSFIINCIHSLQTIADRRNISLTFLPSESLEIECDPLKLRLAVNNLIENAIKYTNKDGHVQIKIIKSGAEAKIVIIDDGVGMEEKHLPHIFERFYRVDKARSRETGGTGLGLYLVQRIALLHGGRVEVTSQPQKGSEFTLIVPIHQR